jgi:hypothetical protein
MFEDQTIELLPARTVMTVMNPHPGGSRVRQSNSAYVHQGGYQGGGNSQNNAAAIQQVNQNGAWNTSYQSATVAAGNGLVIIG